MPSSPALPPELAPLARRLDHGEDVLVLVGSGVSIGATGVPHASWSGLLRHAIDHLVSTGVFTSRHGAQLSASLEKAFSPFDLQAVLTHADLVEKTLQTPDPSAYAAWLESAFRDLKASPDRLETLQVLRDLHSAGALLATTNYDGLLSEVTSLPPVTWEQHTGFLRVMNRQDQGILHLHGHWRYPSSVVLGQGSYDRIVRDDDFQDAFKSLWFGWSWLYVGCGDTLKDPNLGLLLEWGRRWGEAALDHYFLNISEKALSLAADPEKPSYIFPCGYPDHAALPGVLRSILPSTRSRPFIPVDDQFALFRSPGSGSDIPFPSYQEYLSGQVPSLAADSQVVERLEEHGWAFILDVASVGKTTLSLRIATSPSQHPRPVWYLDLSTVDEEELGPQAVLALARLARPGTLFILDNVHHLPELARLLWDQWQDRSSGSHLLLVATRIQRPAVTSPQQDLTFFSAHPDNPAIELRPAPADLGNILSHIVSRLGDSSSRSFPAPPPAVLEDWHHRFGSTLGAFCIAARSRLAEFQKGNWDIPLHAASDWIYEKVLDKLNQESLENVICLSVFASQELEMAVQEDTLPFPGWIAHLMRTRPGLVLRTDHGRFGQYHRYRLLEPGMGQLILAALEKPVEEEQVLFETSSRHPVMTVILVSRLRTQGGLDRLERLGAYLDAHPEDLVRIIIDIELSWKTSLLTWASNAGRAELVDRLWTAIESEPDRLAAIAWETPLGYLANFLETARLHDRDINILWAAIESQPDRLVALNRDKNLVYVASFMETAQRHKRKVAPLWRSIESQPDHLEAIAWKTSLGDIASFMKTALKHGCKVKPLWSALVSQPDHLAAIAWETHLGQVASFMETARKHGQNVAPLWAAIESRPDRLVDITWETPLDQIAFYSDVARDHERDVVPLWDAIESQPDRLTPRLLETPLVHLTGFFNAAREQEREVTSLWAILENHPDHLAELGLNTDSADLSGFCRFAPDSIVSLVLRGYHPGHWKDFPPSQVFLGATLLASSALRVGRQDLAREIISLLLARSDPRDFHAQAPSFSNVAWLLAHVPAEEVPRIPGFISAVCTAPWLYSQYGNISSTGSLAAGLRLLAFSRSVDICQRFFHPALNLRLEKELLRFRGATPADQALIIQLVGSASFFGCRMNRALISSLPVSLVLSLPVSALPHQAEATRVEDWQYQLWLGLRVFASITGIIIPVPAEVISQTLSLWKANLAETSADPASMAHRVNQSMVTWLESCLQHGRGLIPTFPLPAPAS